MFFIKKAIIQTGTPYQDDLAPGVLGCITKRFIFYYTPFTRVEALIQKACKACGCTNDESELRLRFSIHNADTSFLPHLDASVTRLIAYLGYPATVYLEYAIGIPGGRGIERKNGIRYFFHTKELRHLPHVHAEYQGDEISIDILSPKIRKGGFKNKRKEKEAVEYVRNHAEELLQQYNECTNGVHAFERIVNNGKTTYLLIEE